MRVRGLSSQADFAQISVANVEAFLTDLAVDGNVAAATQDVAFFCNEIFVSAHSFASHGRRQRDAKRQAQDDSDGAEQG